MNIKITEIKWSTLICLRVVTFLLHLSPGVPLAQQTQERQPTQIWYETWGSSHYHSGRRVTIDRGYLYVVGNTESYSPGSRDVFLLKYDTNGNHLWNTTWCGSFDESGCGVTTKSGYLYVVGFTESYRACCFDTVLLKYSDPIPECSTILLPVMAIVVITFIMSMRKRWHHKETDKISIDPTRKCIAKKMG